VTRTDMNAPQQSPSAPFLKYVDLASARLGGKALLANDEFFAEKENLLKPGRGEFIPDKYTDRGKWMDGWETRRRRTPGHDWCIVQLGLRGIIQGVDIDTNHFLGNNPTSASLDACDLAKAVKAEDLPDEHWAPILPQSPTGPGCQNLYPISHTRPLTHVRLNIFPDGGVARLRVYGIVVPDWSRHKACDLVDLAAVVNGGFAVACSDMFFSNVNNMLMPDRAPNMGDGWETRRRRGPGHDWSIVKLGRRGTIRRLEIDTAFFKGNYPDSCSVEGCNVPEKDGGPPSASEAWTEILPQTKLGPDRVHLFEKELVAEGEFTHVRLNIYPDGGISRFRVWGVPE
jgi:allantoicase